MSIAERKDPPDAESSGIAHTVCSSFVTIAAASLCLAIAPQPDFSDKIGASRASAVAPQVAAHIPAHADTEVKMVGSQAENTKPCDEQTWPYIDRRCLTVAENKPLLESRNATIRKVTPLGVSDLLAGVRPNTRAVSPTAASSAPGKTQQTSLPVESMTVIAPRSPAKDMQADTVGIAVRDEETKAGCADAACRAGSDVPLPQPRPDMALADRSDGNDADEAGFALPSPAMSRAQQRSLDRERRRLERAERRADSSRIVRRWSEYSYGDGDPRRVVVIHRGPRFDRFFRDFR